MSPEQNLSSKPRRNSMRYDGFDYTSSGAYFVTFCTRHGECLFGDIQAQEMMLNEIGEIANRCWLAIPEHFPQVVLDEAAIMPNHGHAILWIVNDLKRLAETRSGMACHAATSFSQATNEPVTREFGKPIAGSLSTIIGSYKSVVSKEANERELLLGRMRWQDNFWAILSATMMIWNGVEVISGQIQLVGTKINCIQMHRPISLIVHGTLRRATIYRGPLVSS